MRKLIGFMMAVIGVLAIVGMADAAGTFTAALSGGEEVPPVDTDTSGRVRIVFNDDDTTAEFQLQVRQAWVLHKPISTVHPLASMVPS
jgi:CHRD domain-containing protein